MSILRHASVVIGAIAISEAAVAQPNLTIRNAGPYQRNCGDLL
jgi:hypothetical protein